MPLKDLAQFTNDELSRGLAITEDRLVREYIARLLRDRATDAAAGRPEITSLGFPDPRKLPYTPSAKLGSTS